MNLFRRLYEPITSQEPAFRLIRSTALEQWKLVAINLASNLVGAASEGATFGVVFFAVDVLSPKQGSPHDWSNLPVFAGFPSFAVWLNALPPTLLFFILLVLAVFLQALQSLSRYLSDLSTGYFSARCRALVTSLIHSQVLSLSFSCASRYKVGDLTDHAGEGPLAIRFQIEQMSALLVGLLLCATYVGVMVKISPRLLLAVLVMGAAISLLQKYLLPRIRAGSEAVTLSQVAISMRITEDFQGLRFLHSSGQLNASVWRVREGMGDLENRLRRQARRMALIGPVASLLPILAIASIAVISLLLLGGSPSGILPILVTFIFALQKLNSRISIITTNLNLLADNSGRFKRLNAILSPEGKQFRRLGGTPFTALHEAVRFEGVGLHYSSDLPPALRDITFTIPRGQMLALVGSSGAGKSSIADLLTGLYEPTAGRIFIDEIPLDQVDLASWQQRLGVVSQDTFLFNATIAENISFGTPGATRAQIEAACSAAQAMGFIDSLPDGYDTLVGERGYRLSGGQRQRLSLARAILRDPELLILDEATSALDTQSERLVQEAIEQFERNHTVLVIAHRLSTIRSANQILVLGNGRILERGTHDELLGCGAYYSELWALQAKSSVTVKPKNEL